MFSDTVTIFNCVENKAEETMHWYLTVLHDVEAQITKGQNIIKSGNSDASALYLNIPLISSNGEVFADGVKYLKPKAYKALNDKLNTFTLSSENDFVAIGDYSNLSSTYIDEDNYTDGFFEYMKNTYDDVYNISTVDEYKTIRHIEVGGK